MQKVIRVASGDKKDKQNLEQLLSEGWKVKTSTNQSQGYGFFKTCCLGIIFLPLALLGKKKDIMEYVLEKEDSKDLEVIKNNKKENEDE